MLMTGWGLDRLNPGVSSVLSDALTAIAMAAVFLLEQSLQGQFPGGRGRVRRYLKSACKFVFHRLGMGISSTTQVLALESIFSWQRFELGFR